jgi:hypothetical protein
MGGYGSGPCRVLGSEFCAGAGEEGVVRVGTWIGRVGWEGVCGRGNNNAWLESC